MEPLCWIWTWSLLIACIWSAAPPTYSIHRQQISFDDAFEDCSPGALTTLATKEELSEVLSLISQNQESDQFFFWIGLKKVNGKCGNALVPLRGFSWVQDGSEESVVSRWAMEPEPTCLSQRCGALMVRLNGSQVSDWGLVSVACKTKYQYICKTQGGVGPPALATLQPGPEHQPEPQTEAPGLERGPGPQGPGVTQEQPRPKPFGPELNPDPELEAHTPSLLYHHSEPTPNPDLVHGAGHDPVSGPTPDPLNPPSCKKPHVPSARFLTLEQERPLRRLWVECWPGQRVQVQCLGVPPTWHLLNGSPANFSRVCQPCSHGFQSDEVGDCIDVDECEGGRGPCRQSCVNTLGSYRCTCLDQSGRPQEDPALCSSSQTPESRCLLLLLLPLLHLPLGLFNTQ